MSCGKKTRHTERIGCCAKCGELFSSDAAHARHFVSMVCVDPSQRGLVARPSRTAPDEVVWHIPLSPQALGRLARLRAEAVTPGGQESPWHSDLRAEQDLGGVEVPPSDLRPLETLPR